MLPPRSGPLLATCQQKAAAARLDRDGRGKMIHALLGGLVIATVFNGLALMGISAAGVDIATAIVLILAVTVDSLVRRRGATAT